MSASLVSADKNEVLFNKLQNLDSLLTRAAGEQALAKVVPVVVDHNFGKVLADVIDQKVDHPDLGLRHFLLKKS